MQDPEVAAREKWEAGLEKLMAGELDDAIARFDESLAILPSADAYTYRGWAYSFQGRIDDAIAECERAIATDPDFGNPYNDIGCYLMQKQDLDRAVSWFEKAKQARRYEPRHFPYLNMGRLLLAKGEVNEAKEQFQAALQIHPGDPVALRFLSALNQR